MNSNLFNELKLNRGTDERLKMLTQELTRLMENKKNRSFIEKMKPKKTKIMPKGWD